MYDFRDKTVLVTGSSRGIGRSVARAFAQAGARVAVHFGSNATEAERTLESLPGEGHRVFGAALDETGSAERLIEQVTGEFERLDILVNNAGVYRARDLEDLEFEEWTALWEKTIRTNLLGPAHLTYWASRHMAERGGGRIVCVSSRGAFRGEPRAPWYGASKAGLNAMSQSLAQALAPKNIFVGIVAPGFVDTGMARPELEGSLGESIRGQSPLGRVAVPEEVARAVLFLASEGTEFMTGAILDVNGASYLRS